MKTDVVVLLVTEKKPKEAQSVTGCTGGGKYGQRGESVKAAFGFKKTSPACRFKAQGFCLFSANLLGSDGGRLVERLAAAAAQRVSVPAGVAVFVAAVPAEHQRLPGAELPAGADPQRPDVVAEPAEVSFSAGAGVEDAAAATEQLRVQLGQVAAFVEADWLQGGAGGLEVVVAAQR